MLLFIYVYCLWEFFLIKNNLRVSLAIYQRMDFPIDLLFLKSLYVARQWRHEDAQLFTATFHFSVPSEKLTSFRCNPVCKNLFFEMYLLRLTEIHQDLLYQDCMRTPECVFTNWKNPTGFPVFKMVNVIFFALVHSGKKDLLPLSFTEAGNGPF